MTERKVEGNSTPFICCVKEPVICAKPDSSCEGRRFKLWAIRLEMMELGSGAGLGASMGVGGYGQGVELGMGFEAESPRVHPISRLHNTVATSRSPARSR